jgi:hypothetical protein
MRKNIALQSSQILYTFVLRAEIATTFAPKMDKICMPAVSVDKYNLFVCTIAKENLCRKVLLWFWWQSKGGLEAG